MTKIEGVYSIEQIQEQLAKNYLGGDSMLTLQFLLDQYLDLKEAYDALRWKYILTVGDFSE